MAKARRGYRLIQVEIPANEYEALRQVGEASYRSIEQQAAYVLHQAIVEVEAQMVKAAYNGELAAESEELELDGVEASAE